MALDLISGEPQVLAGLRREGETADDLRLHRVAGMILRPSAWTQLQRQPLRPLRWERPVPFSEENLFEVPEDACGLYSFVASPHIADHPAVNYLMYVGMTAKQTFRVRYRQYLGERRRAKGRPLVQELLKRWDGFLWFYYAPLDPKLGNIEELEKRLLAAYLPPFNAKIGVEIDRAKKKAFK